MFLVPLTLNFKFIVFRGIQSNTIWTFLAILRCYWPDLDSICLFVIVNYYRFLFWSRSVMSWMFLILYNCSDWNSPGEWHVNSVPLPHLKGVQTGGWALIIACCIMQRKCLALLVALQFLKYWIMLNIIIMIIVPSTDTSISNQLSIIKEYFSCISCRPYSCVEIVPFLILVFQDRFV